jgi:hypothetical protein
LDGSAAAGRFHGVTKIWVVEAYNEKGCTNSSYGKKCPLLQLALQLEAPCLMMGFVNWWNYTHVASFSLI